MNETNKINTTNHQFDSKPYKQVKIVDNNISPEESLEEPEPKIRCYYCQETIKQGSELEGIFNLSIFTLGIGLLALPQKVKYMSLFMTPMIIISGGVINYWTLTILGDASRKFKLTKYEDTISFLINKKFSYFFSFVMCINQIGTIIAFQIIIYKFLGAIVNQILSYGYENMENFAAKSFWGDEKVRMIVCYSICYIILFPLCLTKTLSNGFIITILFYLFNSSNLTQHNTFHYTTLRYRHNIAILLRIHPVVLCKADIFVRFRNQRTKRHNTNR